MLVLARVYIKITDHIKYLLSTVIDPLDMVIIGVVFVSDKQSKAAVRYLVRSNKLVDF